MRQLSGVLKTNLKYNLLPFILAAVGLELFTPVLFSITALDVQQAAYPLELALPFMGVILLTPIFTPEKESGILSTVASRKMPYVLILMLRVLALLVILLALATGFTWVMKLQESQVTLSHGLAAFANGVFLGGLGMLAAAISGNSIIGYMVPVMYFVLDLMGASMPLTLFSLLREGLIKGKGLLFFTGTGCMVASLLQIHLGKAFGR